MKGAPNEFEKRLVELIVNRVHQRDGEELRRVRSKLAQAKLEIHDYEQIILEMHDQVDNYTYKMYDNMKPMGLVPNEPTFGGICPTCCHYFTATEAVSMACNACGTGISCRKWCDKRRDEPLKRFECTCGLPLCADCTVCVYCKQAE
jgi:hypothetical protein